MQYDYDDNGVRAEVLSQVRRVVVKVGTRLLMDVKGEGASERIRQLVGVVAQLRQSGLDIVVVTSGAIGAGMEQVCALVSAAQRGWVSDFGDPNARRGKTRQSGIDTTK